MHLASISSLTNMSIIHLIMNISPFGVGYIDQMSTFEQLKFKSLLMVSRIFIPGVPLPLNIGLLSVRSAQRVYHLFHDKYYPCNKQ